MIWNLVNVGGQGSRLEQRDLSGAFLWRVDLSQANRRRAKLNHADLTEADLTQADLRGAELRGLG